jgi:hypothetical protein
MNDSRAMRAVERVRDLGGDGQSFLQGQRAFGDAVGQRLPFEILDDKVTNYVMADG